MQSTATTVEEYLVSLPVARRTALQAVREVILGHLPVGYKESMQYGMIGYGVPLKLYPAGYHANPKQPIPYAALASQKNYMAIYLLSICGEPGAEEWFRAAYLKTGKKLDMGKSCVRFKKLEDLPLELIGEAVAREPVAQMVEWNEQARNRTRQRRH